MKTYMNISFKHLTSVVIHRIRYLEGDYILNNCLFWFGDYVNAEVVLLNATGIVAEKHGKQTTTTKYAHSLHRGAFAGWLVANILICFAVYYGTVFTILTGMFFSTNSTPI